MPISSIEAAGVSALSGGAIVAFIMKLLPVLLKRTNGNNKNNGGNGKPGKAKSCIKHGELAHGHEILITQLCANLTEFKETAETARQENREDHIVINKKLDALK